MGLMEVIYVIILGIIEGITEWLPISSTGHLILFEAIYPNLLSKSFSELFNVIIQLGAILSVIFLFHKDIIPIKFENDEYTVKDKYILWSKVIVSCIPVVIVGLFFDDYFYNTFHNPFYVGLCLVLYGLVFILLESFYKKDRNINSVLKITYKSAFIIGLFQILALSPGTSRSGVTMIGASLLLFNRETTVKFSFIQAIPIMLGASILKLFKFMFNENITHNEIILLLIGTLTSFVVSLFVLRWLLEFVKRHNYNFFGFYRIILGLIVLSCIILGSISAS